MPTLVVLGCPPGCKAVLFLPPAPAGQAEAPASSPCFSPVELWVGSTCPFPLCLVDKQGGGAGGSPQGLALPCEPRDPLRAAWLCPQPAAPCCRPGFLQGPPGLCPADAAWSDVEQHQGTLGCRGVDTVQAAGPGRPDRIPLGMQAAVGSLAFSSSNYRREEHLPGPKLKKPQALAPAPQLWLCFCQGLGSVHTAAGMRQAGLGLSLRPLHWLFWVRGGHLGIIAAPMFPTTVHGGVWAGSGWSTARAAGLLTAPAG